MPKFPDEFNLRTPVSLTDKLLIHNITSGETEYTTVQALLAGLSIYGDVGIGTTTPQGKLHVASGNIVLDNNYEIWWRNGADTLFITGLDLDDDDVMLFYDGKMVIDASGKVGIGIINPTAKLQVVGLVEYADNAAAILGGLTVGAFYRTGDILKVVH